MTDKGKGADPEAAMTGVCGVHGRVKRLQRVQSQRARRQFGLALCALRLSHDRQQADLVKIEGKRLSVRIYRDTSHRWSVGFVLGDGMQAHGIMLGYNRIEWERPYEYRRKKEKPEIGGARPVRIRPPRPPVPPGSCPHHGTASVLRGICVLCAKQEGATLNCEGEALARNLGWQQS